MSQSFESLDGWGRGWAWSWAASCNSPTPIAGIVGIHGVWKRQGAVVKGSDELGRSLIDVDQCSSYLKRWGWDINIQNLLEQSVAVMLIRNSFRAMGYHNASLFDITLPFWTYKAASQNLAASPSTQLLQDTGWEGKAGKQARKRGYFWSFFNKSKIKKSALWQSIYWWQTARNLAKTQAEKKKPGNKPRNRVISDRFLEKALKKIQPCDSRNGGGRWQRSLAKTQNEKNSQQARKQAKKPSCFW